MKLIPNAGRVALRAHSMWFGCYLPVFWLIGVELLYAWFALEISPVLNWLVAALIATFAGPFRLVDQGLSK